MTQLLRLVKFGNLNGNLLPIFYPLVDESQYKLAVELAIKENRRFGETLDQLNADGYRLDSFANIQDDKKLNYQIAIFVKLEN
jgi:hypothetical protein